MNKLSSRWLSLSGSGFYERWQPVNTWRGSLLLLTAVLRRALACG
jgi:hypothetical protein